MQTNRSAQHLLLRSKSRSQGVRTGLSSDRFFAFRFHLVVHQSEIHSLLLINNIEHMSIIILLSGRSWTSVENTDLDDILAKDSCLCGPTYIARDRIPLTPDEFNLFKVLNACQLNELTWSSPDTPAQVIAKLYHYGYKLISQAGNACGFSGKARYSADVAVTDYRWSWTLIRELRSTDRPPPYASTSSLNQIWTRGLYSSERKTHPSIKRSKKHAILPIVKTAIK